MQEKVSWLGKQVNLTNKFSKDNGLSGNKEGRPGRDVIHYETTESVVGFLVYVSQTCMMIVPYLKGIYLTLNLWRKGQNKNGWMTKKAGSEVWMGIS